MTSGPPPSSLQQPVNRIKGPTGADESEAGFGITAHTWHEFAEAIPLELRQQDRWHVWTTEQPAGEMFARRQLAQAFKEYPDLPLTVDNPPARVARGRREVRSPQGTDFPLAIHYLNFRSGDLDGVAFTHEDGRIEYFPLTDPQLARP